MSRPERSTSQHDRDLATLAAGGYTGWWNEHGQPAPWPDDFPDTLDDPDTEWRPSTNNPTVLAPGEQPF